VLGESVLGDPETLSAFASRLADESGISVVPLLVEQATMPARVTTIS
jgi:hypothetical protein